MSHMESVNRAKKKIKRLQEIFSEKEIDWHSAAHEARDLSALATARCSEQPKHHK
jgi:hypothetical protein